MMKKILFVALVACMCSLNVAAQSTRVIKGAVIDKNGNPLPGAMVEATGGAESTVVDADGTFSMEVPVWLKSVTVKYAGMKDQKMKVGYGDMIATMKPSGGTKWFLNAVVTPVMGGYASSGEDVSTMVQLGLRSGFFKHNWGMYWDFSYGFENDKHEATLEIGIGAMRRVWKSMYVYMGSGITSIAREYNENDAPYYYYYSGDKMPGREAGVLFEGGVMYHIIKHLNASAGYAYGTNFDGTEKHQLKFTVGYVF